MPGSPAHDDWLALVPDEGWSDHSAEGALFATANRAHAQLAEAGYTATADGAGWTRSDLSGRTPLLELRCGSDVYLRRRFQHGGLLRAITGERFRDPRRPLAEVGLANRLRQLGIRAPEFAAARAQPLGLSGWRLDLLLLRIPDVEDVESLIARAYRGEVLDHDLREVLRRLGKAIARLHAVRFLHADLTPKNILLDGEELVFVDLDRSQFFERDLEDRERQENLRRLFRYVARREGNRSRRLLQRTDYLRFLRAYCRADSSGSAWKEIWRAIEEAHAKAARTHRAGWLLERLLGRGETRATWRG